MERSGRDFEADAGEDEHEGDDDACACAVATGGESSGDTIVGGGAGDAVHEAHAVEQHGAGEGAEKDVFERRLAASGVALEVADEDVERQL